MQVGIRTVDGHLLMGNLQLVGSCPSGEQAWTFRDHFEINQMMQFVQSLPEDLEVSRVKYTNMPLHWNILAPNAANKKGVSTIATITPDPHFALWTVIVRDAFLEYPCFTPIKGHVVGLPGVKTY